MTPLTTTRQLLPRLGGDGFEGDGSTPLPSVDPGVGENYSGVFGTAAVHYGLGRLFVGIGGYSGGRYGDGIEYTSTPFMRALDWNNLKDAWLSLDTGDGIKRYLFSRPPMYTTAGEAGVSSPAVVNDVVFVSTSKPGLYALDAAIGFCLWSATGLMPGFILGPAIYGNNVVVGTGNAINIYSLP
jgi:outer membrane protein assembly factor BamB